jgi:hypothetical protein
MSNSIKHLLKQYAHKLKTSLFSRDVLSFLGFLVFAFVFWFVNALDKERTAEIRLPVRIAGIAPEINLINQTAELRIKVSDKGTKLLTYSGEKAKPLVFNLPHDLAKKGKITFNSADINAQLAKIFKQSTEIIYVQPDTVFVEYEKLNRRVVPVELDADITPAQQYELNTIRVVPREVAVFGRKNLIDSIRTIKTKHLIINNLKDSVSVKCELAPLANVKLGVSSVQVTLLSEMFTEKKILLPVKVINKPANVKIKTFPANVEVTFNVGMSNFNSITNSDIRVLFDYSTIMKGSATQRLKISYSSERISKASVSPEEVEYIIEYN